MKKTIYILIMTCVFLFTQTVLFGQFEQNENQFKNLMSVSAGYGAHHGGIGLKAVIGAKSKISNDSGIVFGIGTFNEKTMYEIGLQLESDNYYATISWGGIGTETETSWGANNMEEETKVIEGWTVIGGRIFDLSNDGKWFIDLGLGYSGGKTTFFEGTSYEYECEWEFVTFDAGLGIRF